MNSNPWTPSTREEVIAVLWLIAALLAFNGGHAVAGWILLIKSSLDVVCAIMLAITETLNETKEDLDGRKRFN